MKYSQEEKEMWLEDWRKSGKSVWAYAKSNNINVQTFSNWIKKAEETEQCFVEVAGGMAVKPVLEQSINSHEILIEKDDVRIRIPLTIGIVGLRAVIEGLRSNL